MARLALGAPTSRRGSLPSPAPTLDSSSLRFLLNSYVPSDRLFGVTKNLQCRTKGYGGPAGTVVRRPMDIVITSALVILIVGCVLGYSFRAEIASDRPAEPHGGADLSRHYAGRGSAEPLRVDTCWVVRSIGFVGAMAFRSSDSASCAILRQRRARSRYVTRSTSSAA
jgi:hypothetical protein